VTAIAARRFILVGLLAAGTIVSSSPSMSRGAPAGLAFAPTPAGPTYGGVPGALPPNFAYAYDSSYTGWPVAPTHLQHPVRGSFLDPRGLDDTGLSGYHFGIDISIDDRHPEPGAPRSLSHRIYAVESGVVDQPSHNLAHPCLYRRMEIGHFDYWHVSPIVRQGERVTAGEQIGWSCLGVWHVHLSEWQRYRGSRVWVNPLHKRGRLVPYTDAARPIVKALAFHTPPLHPWAPTTSLVQGDTSRRLDPASLHGVVELRANIADPQSFLGFLARNPAWPTAFTPYRVAVAIRSLQTGATVMKRVSFQADQMPQTPYIVHYAPGTIEDDNMQECVGPPARPHCAGTYWFRPFSRFREEYWNTKGVQNGRYLVTVSATDLSRNVGARSVVVTVRN
jgi:hypothetical protein